MGNLAIVAIDPLLVLQKIAYAYAATFSEGGWNVIAEPRTAPISYISRLVGIEPIYLSSLALFHAKWLMIVIALTTSLIGVAFVFGLARHVKCYALLLVPAAITAFHVLPFLGLRPHFYSAAKLVLAWSWPLPVGLAACCVGGSQKLRAALVVAICLFASANMETFRRAKSKLIELDTFKSAAESDRVVGIIRQTAGSDSQIVLKSNDPVAGLYWFQVLDNHALATSRNLVQTAYFSRDTIHGDSSFDAPSDAPTIVIRPNFAFAWQMPNTDLRWVQLPDSKADHTLYGSRLLSLSIERDRSKEPDLNAELK